MVDEVQQLKNIYGDHEIKAVWKEEQDGKTKVATGQITGETTDFITVSGSRGMVTINKKDLIAVKL